MCSSTSMINLDKCHVQFYFYNKLSSLKLSDMSNPSVRHVRGTRFSCIRCDPEYTFTPLFISPPPLVSGDPDDSPTISSLLLAISSLLLPTCKVCEGDSSHHQIGLLPIRFVLPLLRRDNSAVFNLVFSFLSFFYIASQFPWSRNSYDHFVKCL
jgi:hypothetical protein